MAELIESGKTSRKDQMAAELLADTSRAFLDDVKATDIPAKLDAQATWWKGISKDSAPATFDSSQVKDLEKKGWTHSENKFYDELSRVSENGKLKEVETYDKRNGERLSSYISRYDSKEAMEKSGPAQTISISYADGGKNPAHVTVRSGNYSSEFDAKFNKDGTLADAREWGRDKNSTQYTFRSDGSLYEALTRSKTDSSVVNDQLFDKAGAPRSDYNPLYMYEKMKRPVENLYLGLREMRRSGGIF